MTTKLTHAERKRFWRKVLVLPGPDSCWLWQGSKDKDGYGLFGRHGKTERAHRVAWEDLFEPLPDDVVLMHSCDTPPCVRPSHLTAATQAANIADAIEVYMKTIEDEIK